jgi:hypothetical protein
MNFWRKHPSPDISVSEIQARIRGFVYDSQIPNPQEVSSFLGCSAISEEVNNKEEEESDLRVGRISPLIPILYALSHAMAQGTVAHQKEVAQEEIPSEAWKATQKIFTQIATNTLVGAISQLVDLGMLNMPSRKRSSIWKKNR